VNCHLRTALSSDEPFLGEMLYLSLFVPPGAPPVPRSVLSEPRIARHVDSWGTRAGDFGLIAELDAEQVGAAWLRYFSAREPGYGFVDASIPELGVAILPEFRGIGIGTRLVEELLRSAGSVSLSCDPANPAWRLYVRLGFVPLPDGRTMLRRPSR
jgi:GNAT superfamily N-acetyltransferase